MKRIPGPILIFGALVLLAVAWGVGYLMGNSAGSRREAVSALYKDLQFLQDVRGGKPEQAEDHAELFITANFDYLESTPFWLSALQAEFEIDDRATYDRLVTEAAAVSSDFRRTAIPVERAIDEAMKSAEAASSPTP